MKIFHVGVFEKYDSIIELLLCVEINISLRSCLENFTNVGYCTVRVGWV